MRFVPVRLFLFFGVLILTAGSMVDLSAVPETDEQEDAQVEKDPKLKTATFGLG